MGPSFSILRNYLQINNIVYIQHDFNDDDERDFYIPNITNIEDAEDGPILKGGRRRKRRSRRRKRKSRRTRRRF